MRQIPLPISLPDRAIFDNYVPGSNLLLFNALQDVFSVSYHDQQILLWSNYRVGKSHLLQSVCHLAAKKKKQIAYIPLQDLAALNPEILDDLEVLDAICIDDLHLVVGDQEWATAFFRLINACRDKNTVLIMSSTVHPREMTLPFEDLRSRLLWGSVFHLKRLSDRDLLSSLYSRADEKGLEFPVDAAEFLVKRFARDTAELLKFLDALDHESMAQQRRITIPLIKGVLAEQGKG